jgi:DMSO/TMAO reductase YedYZ molybdopterin-dependent catalytic subunit
MPARSIVENPDKWVLEVLGTARTAALSLADLKSLGRDTVTAVLQCSGNGRAFFGHNPSGSPWAVGAAGCVNWTGIAVSKVAAHLGGALEGMRFVTATGGEEIPEGIDELAAVVERSIPLEKGLGDCLLAWEMNGQPIPLTHGGPLRLVVPGYFGCNQIKYVKKLAFAESQSEAKIQKKGYRFRPLGENGGPAQPSMWRMPVKSWINGPGAEEVPVLAGTVRFHGVAFSGERGIERVEVSLDGGQSWKDAEIVGPDMGPNAWRTFQFSAELGPGLHTVVSRATDKQGDIQPERREENERGYGYNAWRDAGLQVEAVAALSSQSTQETPSAAPPPTQATREEVKLTESGARGRQVFTEQSNPPCGSCHTLLDAETVGAIGPDLDSLQPDLARVDKAVTHGVGIMPSFGSTLTPREITDLANYVVEATR